MSMRNINTTDRTNDTTATETYRDNEVVAGATRSPSSDPLVTDANRATTTNDVPGAALERDEPAISGLPPGTTIITTRRVDTNPITPDEMTSNAISSEPPASGYAVETAPTTTQRIQAISNDSPPEGRPRSPVVTDRLPDADDDVDRIEQARTGIEETRAEMSQTIDAIKEKLSPQHLMEEAKDAAKHQASEAVHDVADKAKEMAGNVVEKAQDATHAVVEKAKDMMAMAMDKVQDVKEAVVGGGNRDSNETRSVKSPLDGNLTYETRYRVQETNRNTVNSQSDSASLVDVIRQNPIPVALIGLGLGWLLTSLQKQNKEVKTYYGNDNNRTANSQSDFALNDRDYITPGYSSTVTTTGNRAYPESRSNYTGNRPYNETTGRSTVDARNRVGNIAEDARNRAADVASNVQNRVGDTVHNVQDRVGDVAHTVQDRTADVVHTVQNRASDVASNVQDKATDIAQSARETASNVATVTRQKTETTVSTVGRWIQDQPLAAGAVSLLLGAAVGLALPGTAQENQLFGEKREELAHRATDAAQDLVAKAQDAAQSVVSTAKDALNTAVTEVRDEAKNQAQSLV